jgi:nicotinate-nucleotide adenylyltransferase
VIRTGKNRTIGILGGSFNPPHRGHLHISLMALKRIGLDEVWWLITPGNPLKDNSELNPLSLRVDRANRLIGDPRIRISTFEADHGFTYTADTLDALAKHYPDARLVWLMGADNLAGFHHWERWRDIFNSCPIAVFDRPGYATKALASPAAKIFDRNRIDDADATLLKSIAAPAWAYLRGPTMAISSTLLRATQRQPE